MHGHLPWVLTVCCGQSKLIHKCSAVFPNRKKKVDQQKQRRINTEINIEAETKVTEVKMFP